MTTLTPLSPFGSLWTLRKEMDDLMERFFRAGAEPSEAEPTARDQWWPAVEGALKNGTYVFRVALPGVNPKDVEVSLTKNVLSIRGQRKAQSDGTDCKYFVRELTYGAFERRFSLPEGVDASKIQASYSNGMLELKVPSPQAVAPKTIEIKVENAAEPKAA